MRRLGAFLFALFLPALALAQVYPTNNPTYLPNAVLASATLSAPGSVTFQNNGVDTLVIRLLGTYTGLVGIFEGTESRGTSPTWTALSAQGINGLPRVSSVSANGAFSLNVSGWAQVRFRVTGISTGSVAVTMSGNGGAQQIGVLPLTRATYSAAAIIATGATTHFMSIAGSATMTVRITHVECDGKATGAIAVNITGELDSTADTVDAGTAVTPVKHDQNNAAVTATVVTHTTSPTSGTLIGNVRTGTLSLANATTPVYQTTPLAWDFGGNPGEQEVVLRGVAQSFSLNTSAAFGTGAAVACTVTWTEQ
jgi:hypothetical protein